VVSIIVPVFNASKYLAKCVESLRNMDTALVDIEIILVDDGSTDGSGEMCDGFAAKDNRIHVIHQANQGVSAARNAGLTKAIGDYLMFVDSDDYVDPDIIRYLYQCMMRSDADISVCGFWFVDERTGEINPCAYAKTVKLTGRETLRLIGDEFHSSVWGALFKREKWANVQFCESLLTSEDSLAWFSVLQAADFVIWSKKPLYYYLVRPNSTVHTPSPKKLRDVLFVDTIYKRELKRAFPKAEHVQFDNDYVFRLFRWAVALTRNGYGLSSIDLNILREYAFDTGGLFYKLHDGRAFFSYIALLLPLPLFRVLVCCIVLAIETRIMMSQWRPFRRR